MAEGHTVSKLVRRPTGRAGGVGEAAEIPWDPMAGLLEASALDGLDAVVHLAGESVGGGRWTDARKASIRDSRVLGTRTLVQAMRRAARPPRILVSASAIGYYGDVPGDATVTESSAPGDDFLAEVCVAWEAEANAAREAGVRVVTPRIGVVLDAKGGALQKLLGPFRAGVGGKVGDGRQWMSWITSRDVVRALTYLVDGQVEGPANLVAPGAVTQAVFAKLLAKVLRRPSFIPLPAFAVKSLFGEMGDALLLGGQRVEPRVLVANGFTFESPELESALRAVLA
jgi:hypothetical protein